MLCSISQTATTTLEDVYFLHWITSKLFNVVRFASIVALREAAFHLLGAVFRHVLRVINIEITWMHDLPVFELSRI